MAEAADKAGVRHMTAFTYRFVPAMRYLSYLVERATWVSLTIIALAGCKIGHAQPRLASGQEPRWQR